MDINILSDDQAANLKQLIQQSSRIVLCCHKSPDGDALGSSLALADYLRSKGKEPKVIIPDSYPDFLQWMPGSESLIRFDKHKEQAAELLSEAELLFCLDFNRTSRVDEMQPLLDESKAKKVLIDHHLDPDMDTVVSISHPEMSSTSELVFRIIWQLGDFESIDKKAATNIYCGMMTDTGGFTFASTRAEIFHIIALLLDKGINKDLIYNKVFHNYSADALRFRAHLMLNKLHIVEGTRASFYSVTRREMQRFHFIKGDLEGLVNEPLTMKGHRLSISLREDTMRPNRINVSLRSSCGFHCREMAARFFNGGGHEDAAGGHLFCSIREAEAVALRAIQAYAAQL